MPMNRKSVSRNKITAEEVVETKDGEFMMTGVVEMTTMTEATGEAGTDTMIETEVEDIGVMGTVEKTHEGEATDMDTMTGVNMMIGMRMITGAKEGEVTDRDTRTGENTMRGLRMRVDAKGVSILR